MGLIFKYTAIFNSLLAITLGFFILQRGSLKRLKILFFLFSLSIGLYAFFFASSIYAKNPEVSLLEVRIFHFFCCFIASFMYLFSIELSSSNALKKFGHFLTLFSAIIVSGFIFFGDVISRVEPVGRLPNWTVPGSQFIVYLLHYGIFSTLSIIILYRAIKQTSGEKRSQIKLVLWGLAIGLFGGWTTFLPGWGIKIEPHGIHFIFVFQFFLAYAITKHDLMDIKVVIGRSLAFFFTAVVFSLGYLTLLVPYKIYISTQIDLPFIIGSIIYASLGVGLFFHRVQLFIQTTAYKKFLKFKYNFEDTLKNASLKLVFAQTKTDVLDSVFTIQESMEIGASYAILRQESGDDFECFRFNKFEEDPLTGKSSIQLVETLKTENPLIQAFVSAETTVIAYDTVARLAKAELKKLNIHKKSIFLVIHSFKELQAIFIIGPKLSEDPYTAEDKALFEVVLNQAITVFERITQAKRLVQLNQELEATNEDLEFKINEAIALAQKHYHQAALSSLVSGISHEIRNPMATLLGSASFVARTYGGRQKDLQPRRIRVRDADAHAHSSPWRFYVTADEFLFAVGGDHALATAVVRQLFDSGMLTQDGELTEKVDLTTLDLEWIELGSTFQGYRDAIFDVLKRIVRLGVLFKFLNVVGTQIPRILTITDNMMKYGVSGGGVKKDVFASIDGLTLEDSELIFNTLVKHQYLDHKGCVLPAFKGDDADFYEGLKKILPQYHLRMDFIVSLIEQSPGAVKQPVNIHTIVLGALSIQEGVLKTEKILLKTEFEPDLPLVSGDEYRLQQAIFNILFNAQQAMTNFNRPDGSQHQLTVKVERASFQSQSGQSVNGVCVCIQDTGNGMSEKTKKKIFDPFFTTKGPTGGKNIGLGLSILREVVLNHNGMIDVESEENGGTAFKVYLPVYVE